MTAPEKKIVVGRFGKSHGLKGWLRVSSETDPVENILNYQPWQIAHQGQYKTLKVTGSMRQADILLVHIEGYDTPEVAKALAGCLVLTKHAQLPALPTDQFYWVDLEGLSVYTTDNALLGVVDHLMEAGACDVMVIKGDQQHLIPFDKHNVIKQVDLNQRKIIVDWDINAY